MTDRKPDRLDELLEHWAAERAPSADDLDHLRQRVVQSLDEPAAATPLASPGERRERRGRDGGHWKAVAGFVLGAAAAWLLVAGYYWLRPFGPGRDAATGPGQLPPAYCWLEDDQLRNKALLLAEMEDVFDRQLRWLAETADDVQLGIDRVPAASSRDPTAPLAVRLIVERRRPDAPDWDTVWAVDLVARSEEVVRLEAESDPHTTLVLWAYALPDGMISVDTELAFVGQCTIRSVTSGLQKSNEPVRIHAARADGFEYRVYQTVALLQEKVG